MSTRAIASIPRLRTPAVSLERPRLHQDTRIPGSLKDCRWSMHWRARAPARSRGSRALAQGEGCRRDRRFECCLLCLIDVLGLSVMAHSPFRVVADDLVSCQAHGL